MAEFLKDIDPRIIDPKDLDPRISYDQTEDQWLFEDPQTLESFQFNDVLERWLPIESLNEDLSDAQKELQEKKRQKLQEVKEAKQAKSKQKVSTAVYVSNLPLDTDVTELKEIFSKYGIIAEDLLTGKSKIKLYTNEQNEFKGDALVVYLKPESVELAVQMLNETKLRVNGDVISVQKAEFNQSKTEDNEKKHKRPLTEEEKSIIRKRLKTLNEKVDDWNGEDDQINPKWIRTVIIKRAFTLKELEEDPDALKEIEEDMMEGCEELGQVEKVIVFDQEEEGVVMVRFYNSESAVKCIDVSQKLAVTRYNGEHYNKSEPKSKDKTDNTPIRIPTGVEDNDEEEERIQSFIKHVDEE
ncbi:Splicing factor U2AF-associated protein 2 [Wickerhamomyces ciferrii]|uniref:Splicing factor U2AF-associated protein 2 n=1 Tax=Wickerhamomyces ciferrii (strain ATCC 14091 / BCRC 22168 / CBS 111 / JCM 3599 / NBRC 0793 / NRRL Y-1031 F-60-10) TaxID=1206466 RepID=K0KEM3_WICCF|nr:Splicing factor U2AF-associated protein 2 [Wickerhamomyces ciferrii]CCH43585.1 Splicing factor U2AF-associated protein 2 [Wickerhamomyces ciferrii]